jgi:prevent-host-death family protein
MVKAMKRVALAEIKDDLSKYLRLAENEEIVITKHGKPAGILVGFASEDDWFEYKLEHDPRFLNRIAQARASLQAGKGIKLEEPRIGQKSRSRRRGCINLIGLRTTRTSPSHGEVLAISYQLATAITQPGGFRVVWRCRCRCSRC